MYLVGKIVRSHGTEHTPQWDIVTMRRTLGGALKDCYADPAHFFIKLKFGKLPKDAQPVFPRRP